MKLFSKQKHTAIDTPSKTKKDLSATPCMIALEPRIMFDGAGLVSMTDTPASENQDTQDAPDNDTGATQQNETDNNLVELIKDYTPPLAATTKEIVFVDPGVASPEKLFPQQHDDGRLFILLSDQKDAVSQISESLSQFNNLDAIHILSHGSAGKIDFAAGSLDGDNIDSYKSQLTAWANSFSDQGDILLYGCDVASNSEGVSLISKLSQFTDTDVAASDDTSGAVAKGGDWDLEEKTGTIETASPTHFSDYEYTLKIDIQNTNQSIGLGQSEGAALGDLDGDGDLDAFVANSSGGANRVFFNDGSGNYTDSGQLLGSGAWSLEVALGDLDSDGDLDAYVANAQSGDDAIWLNDGNGVFTENAQTLSSGSARGISLADLDRDGDLDAFIAIYGGNEVWMNDGAANFTQYGSSYGSGSSQDVSLGDIDNDGDIDAFVANWNSEANEVWLNDGSGIFSDGGTYGNTTSMGVALADVDQDGDLDAFVANLDGNPDRVWLNNGSGVFTDSGQTLGNNASYNVTMADMDRDGDLDALVVGGNVWENDGSGNFTNTGYYFGGREAAVGDLNQDGAPDIYLATSSATNVWLNTEAPWNLSLFDSGESLGTSTSTSVKFGDLDQDGDVDAFVTNSGSGQADRVWLNNGNGTFTDSGQALGNTMSQSVELADLDQDGDLDAFVAGSGVGANKIWLNDGAGTFTDSGLNLGSNNSEGVALGDIDGDGDLDAFVANDGGGQANKIWLNDGAGNLTDSGQNLGSSESRKVALADLDKDGDLDAFVANKSGQANKIWLNNGSGIFTDSGQNLGTSDSMSVTLADIDYDGDIDAFIGNYNNTANKIWLNNGSGIFTDSGQDIGNASTMNVALVDINGDGYLDAYAANNGSDKVWLNDGAGSFTDDGLTYDAGWTYQAEFADLDQDGDLDAFLTIGGDQSNKIWLTNQAPELIPQNILFYPVQSAAVELNPTLVLNDIDDTEIQSAIITIDFGYIEGEDILSFSNMGNISGNWDAPSATLTLTGADTIAQYETALRSITYDNASATPLIQGKNISFYVDDGNGGAWITETKINLMPTNDPTIFFQGNDGVHGNELARTDGTPEGTSIIADINPNGDSNPSNFTYFKGEVYFTATDGTTGTELWKTDGTAAGTTLVKDIDPGLSSYPAGLTVYNGELFFSANDGTNGYELWKTDGTDAGTVMVKNINTSGHASPSALVVCNGMLYFSATDGVSGHELWQSDGTDAGTVMVKDINIGSDSAFGMSNFIIFDNNIYFDASDGTDTELWKSDGTDAGTVKVKDINTGGGSSWPYNYTVFKGELYFSANDATNGTELWKTDGTDAGTVLVKDINTGGNSYPSSFAVFNNELYFSANDGSDNTELWKTDGTNAGTVLLKDINVGGSSYPSEFRVFNNELYFAASDDTNFKELWKTDGTAGGTVLVKDINVGASSYPSKLTVYNGHLYFVADNGVDGSELFRTDGTDAGTVLVEELNPGLGSTSPSQVSVFDINDQPNLVNTTAPSLFPIGEDNTNSDGTSVSDLIDSIVVDFDHDMANGIAVTAVDDSNGTWEYSLDGGTTWNSFGAVSDTYATLLAGYSNITGKVDDMADLAVGDLLIKGTDIGAVTLTTPLDYGINMEGTANLVNAINSQTGTTNVEATLTTLYAGAPTTADVPDAADTTVTLDLNGTPISFTIPDLTPANEVAEITAERISAFASQTGVHAEVGNAENGGATGTVVLFNIHPGNEAPIIISGLDAVESGMTGLADGTYTADASHNKGEFSLRSSAGDYTITTSAPDDSILELVGLAWHDEMHDGPDIEPPGDGTIDVFSPNNIIRFVPSTDFNGTANISFKAWDLSDGCNGQIGFDTTTTSTTDAFSNTVATSSITVNPIGDTPQVNNITTNEDTQSDPIVIDRNPADGPEITHFRVSSITNGTLYQNDGTTQINDGEYITFAQANAGLRFTPTADSTANGSFNVESSEDGATVAAQSGTVTSTITVTPAGDTPQVNNVTTNEDTQSDPIVIDRNPADGPEVTHFRISSITNGTLYQNDGTTQINDGEYITFAEANAGLRFTPTTNSTTNGSFNVDSSEDGATVAAQSSGATSTITVNPIGDTPLVNNVTTNEDTQSTPIVIDRNPADGPEVSHFRISSITNGTLYQNDGTTLVNDGDYITFAQANAGLRFSPTANSITNGSFNVESSEDGATVAAQSSTTTATITVTPQDDSPIPTSGSTITYQEGDPPTFIDPTITLTDIDSPNMQGATVSVTNNYANGEDVLAFTDTANITGSWDAATGTLTLTGTTSIANYEAALQSITYENQQGNPSNLARTITFNVTDGTTNGTTNSTINVTGDNDAPVLSGGNTLTFQEDSPPIAIDPSLTLSDVDSPTLQGATINIGPGFVEAEDQLFFTNTATIAATWDQASATLTLSGTDTVANYEAALRSVAYKNISDTPSPTERSINYTVNDGAADSGTVVSTINISPENDAPLLVAGNTVLKDIDPEQSINSGTPVMELLNGKVTDIDSPQPGIAVTFRDNANGTWQYSTNNGAFWNDIPPASDDSATLLSSGPGNKIRFRPEPGYEGDASISFRAWDQSTGAPEDTLVDVSTNGGNSAFSDISRTASVTVLAAPPAPQPPPVEPPPVQPPPPTGETTTPQTQTSTITPSPLPGIAPLPSQPTGENSNLQQVVPPPPLPGTLAEGPSSSELPPATDIPAGDQPPEPPPEAAPETQGELPPEPASETDAQGEPELQQKQDKAGEEPPQDAPQEQPESAEEVKEEAQEEEKKEELEEDEQEETEEELEEEVEEEQEEQVEEEAAADEVVAAAQTKDKVKKEVGKEQKNKTGLSSQLKAEAEQSSTERTEIIKVMDEIFNILQCK